MRIAGLLQDSIVDGPGLRFTVFTQGCPHRCVGCHNPETHDPNGGADVAVDEVINKMLSNPLTDGVTLSGGEPFFQPADCVKIAEAAKNADLNIWTYTGWTFEELLGSPDPDIQKLLSLTDVLVDGRFVLRERSLNLKWRGSKNQRLLDIRRSLAEGCAVRVE
jgi:anaerobic ribonucleoside-triphosphate reductase activating protein